QAKNKIIRSLSLSNSHICGQIKYWYDNYDTEQQQQLNSLSLLWPTVDDLKYLLPILLSKTKNLNNLHLVNHPTLTENRSDNDKLIIKSALFELLKQLKSFTFLCDLFSFKNISSTISTTIQYLHLNKIDSFDLIIIFQHIPNLKSLTIELLNGITVPLSAVVAINMKQLKIKATTALFNGTHDLLKSIPNIQYLSIFSSIDQNQIDGNYWSSILSTLTNLKHFEFHIAASDCPNNVQELKSSYESMFWLIEHQWYVNIEYQTDKFHNYITIYTIPYPCNGYTLLSQREQFQLLTTNPSTTTNDLYQRVHILTMRSKGTHHYFSDIHTLQCHQNLNLSSFRNDELLLKLFSSTLNLSTIVDLYLISSIDINSYLLFSKMSSLKILRLTYSVLLKITNDFQYDDLCAYFHDHIEQLHFQQDHQGRINPPLYMKRNIMFKKFLAVFNTNMKYLGCEVEFVNDVIYMLPMLLTEMVNIIEIQMKVLKMKLIRQCDIGAKYRSISKLSREFRTNVDRLLRRQMKQRQQQFDVNYVGTHVCVWIGKQGYNHDHEHEIDITGQAMTSIDV
ncbi:unnamed protein product, partial [Didymodactylos carnosus]